MVLPNTTGVRLLEVFIDTSDWSSESSILPIIGWHLHDEDQTDPIVPFVNLDDLGSWALLSPDGSVYDTEGTTFQTVDQFIVQMVKAKQHAIAQRAAKAASAPQGVV